MRKNIIEAVKEAIKCVAVVSSESTSVLSLYQPKKPKALIKSDKKK